MRGIEVKTQLAFVEWSPDGKNILFCTLNGEAKPFGREIPFSWKFGFVQVHVYDNEGIYSHKVPIYCHPGTLAEDARKLVRSNVQSSQSLTSCQQPCYRSHSTCCRPGLDSGTEGTVAIAGIDWNLGCTAEIQRAIARIS